MSLRSRLGSFLGNSMMPSIVGPVNEKLLADNVAKSEAILRQYGDDLTRMNLMPIGVEFSNEDLDAMRKRARWGDPRWWYDLVGEMMRLGPSAQISKAQEGMKSATAQILTCPEDWNDDETVPDGISPEEVALARSARDYLEDTLSDSLTELLGINGAGQQFFGIADSKIILNPRGNMGKWDSIEAIEEIPQRRHRLDPITHKWLLMPSPDSWEGVPISDLSLNAGFGNEGLFFTEIDPWEHLDRRGLFFKLWDFWIAEQFVTRYYIKHVELYGTTPRYGLVDFSKPEWVAEMKRGLRDMGAFASGVFPIGSEIKLLEAQTGGTNNPHEALLSYIARKYDAIILGHEQASGIQKGVGGKIQGETTVRQMEDRLNSWLRTFSPQLRKGVARPLIARAFGETFAERHTPIIKLRFVDRDNPSDLAGVALQLKQSGAGAAVAMEDLVRRCSLKVAGPDEKNLGDAAGAMPALPATGTPDAIGAEAPMSAATTVQDAALNGAQIGSIQAIVQGVADGTFPAKSAIALIRLACPSVSESEAAALVDPASGFKLASFRPKTTAALSVVQDESPIESKSVDDMKNPPPAFGHSVVDHLRKLVSGSSSLAEMKAKVENAPKPDLTADADEMAASTLKATMLGMIEARKKMEANHPAESRSKANG